jgi:hypothetical protein
VSLQLVGRGFCFEDLKDGFLPHRRTSPSDVELRQPDLAHRGAVCGWTTRRAIKGRMCRGAGHSFAEGLLLPTMQDTGLAFSTPPLT